MLNEQEIEIAARKYCELSGFDPDEKVGHGQHFRHLLLWVPRWMIIAKSVREFDVMRESVACVSKEKGK